MIRNRRSKTGAQVLRGHIAAILGSRSQLDPPVTLKALSETLGGAVSDITIKRARAWVRRAHRAGELPALVNWLKKARRGEHE
jgi:hypothetical protein